MVWRRSSRPLCFKWMWCFSNIKVRIVSGFKPTQRGKITPFWVPSPLVWLGVVEYLKTGWTIYQRNGIHIAWDGGILAVQPLEMAGRKWSATQQAVIQILLDSRDPAMLSLVDPRKWGETHCTLLARTVKWLSKGLLISTRCTGKIIKPGDQFNITNRERCMTFRNIKLFTGDSRSSFLWMHYLVEAIHIRSIALLTCSTLRS